MTAAWYHCAVGLWEAVLTHLTKVLEGLLVCVCGGGVVAVGFVFVLFFIETGSH